LTFWKGFLIKNFPLKFVDLYNVKPTFDEILKFKKPIDLNNDESDSEMDEPEAEAQKNTIL